MLNYSKFHKFSFIDFFISKKCIHNEFVRRVWKTKDIFHSHPVTLIKTFHSIHYLINFIKNWDTNISSLISTRLICPFSTLNFNRLRNIFIRDFQEVKIWSEVERMFKLGILNMSLANVYWGEDIYSFSLLSRFLFELYLEDLDTFILKSLLEIEYSTKCINVTVGNNPAYSMLLLNSLPLKLEKNLKSYITVNNVNILRFNSFFNYFGSNIISSHYRNFNRNFNWVRHINFLFLGFVTTRNYSCFLFDKILAFIRSDILCDAKDIFIGSSLQDNLYFLGFNILLGNLSSKSNLLAYNVRTISKDKLKIQSRINIYRRKTFNLVVKRFNSELFLYFVSFIKKKQIAFGSFIDVKLWTYIFQLECIRSLQNSKLLFSYDSINSLNYSFFSEAKLSIVKKVLFYRSYSFNLYIKKLHILLKDVISSFSSYFPDSIIAIDTLLVKFFNSLKNKIFFVYENLYYNTLNVEAGFTPFALSSFYKDSQYAKGWRVLVSKNFIFRKLRIWGFIHPYKDRPISNSKFLLLEDMQIISKFGFVSEKILTWFRCCDDFSSVKFFVEIIRQSCFLTLSRKHNKSKSWAYSVYTPNLFLRKSLYFSELLFPSRSFLSKITRKILIGHSIFTFNEKFFLTDFNFF